MNKIKKYWKYIILSITSFFGIFTIFLKLFSNTKLSKTKQQLDDNTSKIQIIKGKTEFINAEKTKIKSKIIHTKQKITNLIKNKKNIPTKKNKTVKESKYNIIKKINK